MPDHLPSIYIAKTSILLVLLGISTHKAYLGKNVVLRIEPEQIIEDTSLRFTYDKSIEEKYMGIVQFKFKFKFTWFSSLGW